MYESSGNLFKVDQPIVMGFADGLDDKESACNMGDPGLIPGSGRSREGTGSPLQDSCLENPMGRGAWRATATHTHTHITVTHYTLIQNVHLHLCTEPYRQTHKIWRVDPWLSFTTVARDPLILISPWIQLTLHSPLTVNSPHYSLALKQTRTRTTWKSETENRRQTVTSGLYTLFHIWLTWFLSTYKGKEHCTVCVYLIYLQIIPHLVSSAQLLPIWEKCCLPIPSLSIPSLQTPQILG